MCRICPLPSALCLAVRCSKMFISQPENQPAKQPNNPAPDSSHPLPSLAIHKRKGKSDVFGKSKQTASA